MDYKAELKKLTIDYETRKKEIEQKIIEEERNKIPKKVRNIAEYLHEVLCSCDSRSNCDWHKDKGNWITGTRIHYVNKAKDLLEVADIETIENIMDIIAN